MKGREIHVQGVFPADQERAKVGCYSFCGAARSIHAALEPGRCAEGQACSRVRDRPFSGGGGPLHSNPRAGPARPGAAARVSATRLVPPLGGERRHQVKGLRYRGRRTCRRASAE